MSDVWDRYNSAQALYQKGRVDEAEQEFINLITAQKDFAWGYYELGKLCKDQSRFDEALQHYQRAISLNSDYPWGYFEVGEIHFQQQRFQAAAEQFSKVVAYQPEAMWAYYRLAMSLEKIGDQENAIAAFKTAAYFFEKANQFQQAIEIHRNIIALDKNDASAFRQLGKLLSRENNWKEATVAYEKAIQLDPNFADAYRKLITVLQKYSQIDKAIQFCHRLIDVEPDFYWNYGVLADLLFTAHEKNKALENYKKAVEVQIETLKPNIGYSNWDKNDANSKQVHFFIIGFAKTATTSLYEYLIQHPQVLPPYRKEPHFFSKFMHYGMDWYLAQFPTIPSQKNFITGEGSINYVENKLAPKRIFNHFPQAKLIVVLREPVQRTVSDYYMYIRDGREHRSLEEVINFELSKLKNCTPTQLESGNHWRYPDKCGFVSSLLLRSLYLYHLKRWMQVFPREQFLIIETQQLAETPQQVMTRTFDFLKVSECQSITYKAYNRGNYEKREDALTSKLADFFRPHNRLLEEFLGREFNWIK